MELFNLLLDPLILLITCYPDSTTVQHSIQYCAVLQYTVLVQDLIFVNRMRVRPLASKNTFQCCSVRTALPCTSFFIKILLTLLRCNNIFFSLREEHTRLEKQQYQLIGWQIDRQNDGQIQWSFILSLSVLWLTSTLHQISSKSWRII